MPAVDYYWTADGLPKILKLVKMCKHYPSIRLRWFRHYRFLIERLTNLRDVSPESGYCLESFWVLVQDQASFDVHGHCVSQFESIDWHCGVLSGNFHFRTCPFFCSVGMCPSMIITVVSTNRRYGCRHSWLLPDGWVPKLVRYLVDFDWLIWGDRKWCIEYGDPYVKERFANRGGFLIGEWCYIRATQETAYHSQTVALNLATRNNDSI